MKAAFDGAAEHLATEQLGFTVLACMRTADADELIARLSKSDSVHLQRATSETLAFIGYVKRFTTKEGSEEGADE